jgi:hypothetical protein
LPTASSSSGVTSSNRSFCCTGSSGPLRLGPHLPTSIGAHRSRPRLHDIGTWERTK